MHAQFFGLCEFLYCPVKLALLLEGDAATAAGLSRFDAPASAFDDALLQSVGAKPGSFKIRKDEVFAYLFQGGGG